MSSPTIDPRLITRAPHSLEDLLDLLVSGLGWPLPGHLETLPTLEWTPEELHLDSANLGTLTSIQQIPRLQAEQPFGVFVLRFTGGKLPIGALRRVVAQLVRKQRARHTAHQQWDLGDLIFFCHTDDGRGTVHVVALREEDGKQSIKTISWTSEPTPTRLDLLSKHALPDLAWPQGSIRVDLWRDQWQNAFTAGYRQGVKTAEALSQRMAEVAADIRDELTDLLLVETKGGPLHALLDDFRERLSAGFDEARFADMFAQTLVYGLLSSRISNPGQFEAEESLALLDFENPFMDAIYSRLHAAANDYLDLDHLGLTDLAHTLAATDVDTLLADFGSKDRRDDPVIYLYEEFLNKYDPQQRRDLGAYYTPMPIVAATVRLVDEILVRDLGFTGGVADDTTWRQWAAQGDGRGLPNGIDPSDRVISFLDPATGTGTYLLEWLRVFRRKSPDRIAEALDSMAAIELSLASYAVAHLKAGLELPAGARSTHRLPIYLGDTLAGPRPNLISGIGDPIAEETALVERELVERRHTVVLGNPPYQRLERAAGGGWITGPEGGGRSLFDDIHDPAKKEVIFSAHRSLFNLYVYFWRWAIWDVFERTPEGPGIVGLITGSSWLSGPGFLGLREIARKAADEIWVIDLGGDNKGARPEENVFPIETPVAIVILVRKERANRSSLPIEHYMRLSGSRMSKLSQLGQISCVDSVWNTQESSWHGSFRPRTGMDDWQLMPALTDVFPWQQPGCILSRTWPVAPHPDVLRARWAEFLSRDDANDRAAAFHTAKSGRNIFTQVGNWRRLVDEPIGAEPQPLAGYSFRSFDRQWTFDDPRVAKTDSPALWAGRFDRQVFFLSRTTKALGAGPALVACTDVPDFSAFRGSDGGKDVIPLYREAYGLSNTDPALLRTLSGLLWPNGSGELTAEILMGYCYGLLAGADYTARFAEELETPGPRVPLTRDPVLFTEVAAHGAYLIWLHTLGERFALDQPTQLPRNSQVIWDVEPSAIPETMADIRYVAEVGAIRVGDGLLRGVLPAVWDFQVSGMAVLSKWLGYRTRRGTGRAASSNNPLDQIRPDRWYPEWSDELLELVNVLTATLEALPDGVELLDRVLAGDMITADELPEPSKALRKPPAADRASASPRIF